MGKKKTWKKLIDQVIEGKIDSVDLSKPYVCPSDVVDYLESIGLEGGEMETNGWEHDFWQGFVPVEQPALEVCTEVIGGKEYSHEIYPFMFCGGWYYGTQCFRMNAE